MMENGHTTTSEFESEYTPNSAIDAFHNIPRFGHTNSFSKIFSADEEEQIDYTKGLLFVTSLVISFFLCWQIVIFIFICMGPDRVGFFSGSHFVEPPNKTRIFRRPRRVRIAFLLCSILVLCFAVVLVDKGFGNFRETAAEIEESALEVNAIANSSGQLIQELEDIGSKSSPLRDQLVERLGNFCDDPELESLTGVDFDELAKEAIDQLNLLEDFIANDVANLKDDIDKIEKVSSDVAEASGEVDSYFWAEMVFALPLLVLPSFLIVGMLLSWLNFSVRIYACMEKWIFLPLFGAVVIGSWIFCSLLGIFGALNADFCSGGETNPGSPEETIKEILREQGYFSGSLVHDAVVYYTNSCAADDPFAFIADYEVELDQALDSVSTLFSQVDEVGTDFLSNICSQDFESLRTLLEDLYTNIEDLLAAADAAVDLLGCERIQFIYENTVHDASCTYAMDGLAWMAISLLFISVCGLIMITLRAALYRVEDQERGRTKTGNAVAPDTQKYQAENSESEKGGSSNASYSSESKESKTSTTELEEEGEDVEECEKKPQVQSSARPESTKSWEKYPTVLSDEN